MRIVPLKDDMSAFVAMWSVPPPVFCTSSSSPSAAMAVFCAAVKFVCTLPAGTFTSYTVAPTATKAAEMEAKKAIFFVMSSPFI